MMINATNEVGPIILKALGLPSDKCRGFEIRCFVDEIFTIKAEYYGELNKDLDEFERVIKTFELVEK